MRKHNSTLVNMIPCTTAVVVLLAVVGCASISIAYPQYTVTDPTNRRGLVTAVLNATSNPESLCNLNEVQSISCVCTALGFTSAFPLSIPFVNVNSTLPTTSWCVVGSDGSCITYTPNPDYSETPCTADARSAVLCPLSRSSSTPSKPATVTAFTVYTSSTGNDCTLDNFYAPLGGTGMTQELISLNHHFTVISNTDPIAYPVPWCAYVMYAIDANISAVDLTYYWSNILSSPHFQDLLHVNLTLIDKDISPDSVNNSPNAPWALGTPVPGAMTTPVPGSPSGGPPGPNFINITGWKFRLVNVTTGQPLAIPYGSTSTVWGVFQMLPADASVATWGGIGFRGIDSTTRLAMCGTVGVNATVAYIFPWSQPQLSTGPLYATNLACSGSAPDGALPSLNNNCAWTYDPSGGSLSATVAESAVLYCSNSEPDGLFPPRLLSAFAPSGAYTASSFQEQIANTMDCTTAEVQLLNTVPGGLTPSGPLVRYDFVMVHVPETTPYIPPALNSAARHFSVIAASNAGSAGGAAPVQTEMANYPANLLAAIALTMDPSLLGNITLIVGNASSSTVSTNTSQWSISLESPSNAASLFTSSASGRIGRLRVTPGPNAAPGTICSDGIAPALASQLCSSLMQAVVVGVFLPNYLPGTGPIYLSNLQCLPQTPGCTSYSLSNASYKTNNCSHSSDVGLMCGTNIGPAYAAVTMVFSVVTAYVNAFQYDLPTCVSHVVPFDPSRLALQSTSSGSTITRYVYSVTSPATDSDLSIGDIVLMYSLTGAEVLNSRCAILQTVVVNGTNVVFSTTSAPPSTVPPSPTSTTTASTSAAPLTTLSTAVPPQSTTTTDVPPSSSSTANPSSLPNTTGDVTVTASTSPQTTNTVANASSTAAPISTISTSSPSSSSPTTTAAPSNTSNSTSTTAAGNTTTTVAPTAAGNTTTTVAPSSSSNSPATSTSAPPTSTTSPVVAASVAFSFNGTAPNATSFVAAFAAAMQMSPSDFPVASVTSTSITLKVPNTTVATRAVSLANNGSLTTLGVVSAAAILTTSTPVPYSTTTTTAAPSSSDDSSSNAGLIAGCCVGGLVLLIIIGYIYVKKSSSAKGTGFVDDRNDSNDFEKRLNPDSDTYIALRAI